MVFEKVIFGKVSDPRRFEVKCCDPVRTLFAKKTELKKDRTIQIVETNNIHIFHLLSFLTKIKKELYFDEFP
jgi:hypothetical protein